MDPAGALLELAEVSTQLETAILMSPTGEVEAATVDTTTAAAMAGEGVELVDAARRMAADLGRDGLSQVQAATPQGCVFAVLDSRRVALATTGPDPTVGLVFYDLKTLLRRLARDEAAAAGADA